MKIPNGRSAALSVPFGEHGQARLVLHLGVGGDPTRDMRDLARQLRNLAASIDQEET